MTTAKPRITVTLNPRVYEVLKSITEDSNQPMSSIVSDLLEASLPVFEKMAGTFRHLKTLNTKQRNAVVQALSDAEATFEPLAAKTIDLFGEFSDSVENIAKATDALPRGTRGRHSGRAGGAADKTPPTNRGVTPISNRTRKPSRSKA